MAALTSPSSSRRPSSYGCLGPRHCDQSTIPATPSMSNEIKTFTRPTTYIPNGPGACPGVRAGVRAGAAGIYGAARPLASARRQRGRRSPRTPPLTAAAAGARQRAFLLHVPARYDPASPVPLVLAFHGGGGTAAGLQAAS